MKIFCSSSTSFGNNSLRLEICNINNRREATATDSNNVTREFDPRTNSVSTFEYFIDEETLNGEYFPMKKTMLAVEVETSVVSQASWSMKVTR